MRILKCGVCDKTFLTKRSLLNHKASIHDVNRKKPYMCIICNASFAEKKSLNLHIEYTHEKKRPFKCKICESDFSEKNTVNFVVQFKV